MGTHTTKTALLGNLRPTKTRHTQSVAAGSNSKLAMSVILVLTALFPGLSAQAKYGGEGGLASAARISRYVFLPDQSKLIQTGGIAYVHRTYSIEGQFQLTVDPNAGTASFAHVDTNATDDSPFKRSLDPNHVFNMTSLVGTIVEDGSIKFAGKADDESSILITLALSDGTIVLKGGTTPPPNSADFFIFTLDAVAQRKYGGGTGEPNDPYQIATAADLIALGETPNDYDKHFILTADVDLDPNLSGGKVFDKAAIAPDTDAVNSGYQGTAFTGVFDGNGHTIWHLTITGGSYLGLFGQFASGADVKNLGVVDVNITGSGPAVGGLVGWNMGGVFQCYSTGAVSGEGSVGGLVGYNNHGHLTQSYSGGVVSGDHWVGGLVGGNAGNLTHCYSTDMVSGNSYVGGLVGWNWHTVTQSYSTGAVSGNSSVGGLVGWNLGGVFQCYSTGAVSGEGSVGGLVGWNYADITTSYSTGAVSGEKSVGGLVGQNFGGCVTQCHSTGSVSGDWDVGGLVGYNMFGLVTSCYSTGAVDGNDHVGGLVGRNGQGTVTVCFWDIQTSGQAASDGGTGKTTVEMQTPKTFLQAGWDFVGETANGPEDVWDICEGIDYPRLAWEPNCVPCCHRDYLEWVSVGKPLCWCNPRHCYGDADGKAQGSAKTGFYYVGTNDLNILIPAWQVKEPPYGPGIASIPNGICADFSHDVQGSSKTGFMRVYTHDLGILIGRWLVREPPKGPGVKPDCLECP